MIAEQETGSGRPGSDLGVWAVCSPHRAGLVSLPASVYSPPYPPTGGGLPSSPSSLAPQQPALEEDEKWRVGKRGGTETTQGRNRLTGGCAGKGAGDTRATWPFSRGVGKPQNHTQRSGLKFRPREAAFGESYHFFSNFPLQPRSRLCTPPNAQPTSSPHLLDGV